MKKLFAAALLTASLAGFGAANAAMPASPLSGVTTDDITTVAQGCGPRMSRDRMGRCRPDFRRPPPPRRYAPPRHHHGRPGYGYYR